MAELETIVRRISAVKDGFKPIRAEAGIYLTGHSEAEALAFAHRLYGSDVCQARMMATLLLGRLAAKHPEAFSFLHETVSHDPDWRAQEMLAMSFDNYCKDTGYERALPVIRGWIADANPNVRRAASEGLRIWTHRDYFKQHPEVAIELLSSLKADEHAYVRKSAGNALRDISRFHKDLLVQELASWDRSDPRVADTYKYAARFVAP
jgi:3-methyladenine DNA glycosylase AlkD